MESDPAFLHLQVAGGELVGEVWLQGAAQGGSGMVEGSLRGTGGFVQPQGLGDLLLKKGSAPVRAAARPAVPRPGDSAARGLPRATGSATLHTGPG